MGPLETGEKSLSSFSTNQRQGLSLGPYTTVLGTAPRQLRATGPILKARLIARVAGAWILEPNGPGFWSQADLGSNPGSATGSQCGLRQVLNLSVPLLPHLSNGDDLVSPFMTGV